MGAMQSLNHKPSPMLGTDLPLHSEAALLSFAPLFLLTGIF